VSYVSELPGAARRYFSKTNADAPGGDYDERGMTAQDSWTVPGADLNRFLQVAGGTVEEAGGLFPLRTVPLRFKEMEWIHAERVRWKTIQWDYANDTIRVARVQIDYRTPNYGEDFLSVRSSPFERTITKPAANGMGWQSEPVGGQTYSVTLHKLSILNLELWRQYAGMRNLSAWRGFPADCVKFVGPSTDQKTTIAGVTSYDATLVFQVSRIPWNVTYDSAGALYEGDVPPAVDFASVLGF
jgi:hypothetical protein